MTKMKDDPQYLVLVDGKTNLSEIGEWSYPTLDEAGDWRPGDWKKYDVAISKNRYMKGFGATTKPVERLMLGCDIFLIEGRILLT